MTGIWFLVAYSDQVEVLCNGHRQLHLAVHCLEWAGNELVLSDVQLYLFGMYIQICNLCEDLLNLYTCVLSAGLCLQKKHLEEGWCAEAKKLSLSSCSADTLCCGLDYIHVTERSPADGGNGGSWGVLLSAYCCIPHHTPLVYANEPKLLVAGEDYHP